MYTGTNNRSLRTYGTGGARPASDRTGMGGGRSGTGGARPTKDRELTSAFLSGGASIKEDMFGDKTEVQESFYDWSDEQMQQWAVYCVSLGLLSEEKASDPEALYGAWKDAVGHAATFTAKGRKVDPYQAAAWMASTDNWGRTANGQARGIIGSGGEGGGPETLFTGKKTRTVRTINLTDPATARAMVNSQLTNMLGRRASDEEVDEFIGTLNRFERDNPSVQRTTDTYKNGELVDTANKSSGGVSDSQVNEMIEEDAMALPEYGAFQAASTYYDAFRSAIGAPA